MVNRDDGIDVRVVGDLCCRGNTIGNLHPLHAQDGGAPYEEEAGGEVGDALEQDDRLVTDEISEKKDKDGGDEIRVGPQWIHFAVDLNKGES